MNTLTYYYCPLCGNIVLMVEDSGIVPFCCGKEMKALVPNTVDASLEKHVPVVLRTDDTLHVKIGSHFHPMTTEHYISWVMLVTNLGIKSYSLLPYEDPEAFFALLPNELPLTVYSYCNLHGLWMKAL